MRDTPQTVLEDSPTAEADHGGAIRGRRARAYRRTTGAAAAEE